MLIIVFTDIIVIIFHNLSLKSNPQKESTKEKKNVCDTASELYNDSLGIYYHKYYVLSDDKRNKIRVQM